MSYRVDGVYQGSDAIDLKFRSPEGRKVDKALQSARLPGAIVGLTAFAALILLAGPIVWWVAVVVLFGTPVVMGELIFLAIVFGILLTILGSALGKGKGRWAAASAVSIVVPVILANYTLVRGSGQNFWQCVLWGIPIFCAMAAVVGLLIGWWFERSLPLRWTFFGQLYTRLDQTALYQLPLSRRWLLGGRNILWVLGLAAFSGVVVTLLIPV